MALPENKNEQTGQPTFHKIAKSSFKDGVGKNRKT